MKIAPKVTPESPRLVIPKIWITKRALTSGIVTAVNVEVDGDGRMASFRQATGFPSRVYLHKPDWYDNEEEALDRVRQMIEAKGKSLAKEQAKLAALKAKVASGSLPTNPWKQATEADE